VPFCAAHPSGPPPIPYSVALAASPTQHRLLAYGAVSGEDHAIRWLQMAPFFASNPATLDAAQRDRARERLYVGCQTFGWLLLFGLQVYVTVYFGPRQSRVDRTTNISLIGMVMCLGWLISHFGRPFIHRWNWKDLGWRGLLPRVLTISLIHSILWTAVGFAYSVGVCHRGPPPGTSLPTVMLLSIFNGTILFIGWWCVYFFYHLFDRFNRLQIEQLRLATAVKEAELRELKSQVNPHFIFNALISLRALIDEDPARARLAVTQLANLLRYSLQSAQAELVPFEDELRVVNDYLALEQVRHEERLRLRLDIDPDTLNLPVPPLILQTLVENAVKYGISPRADGGEIEIVARCEDGALKLRVTNPGELAAPGPSANGSTGVGLRNAAERLRLSFGDRARLHVRAQPGSLVVAEVLVPPSIGRGFASA
jgi:signal transduction histidine kinase